MTLKSNSDDYRGFIRVSNTIVENCTLEGKTAYWGYNTATFTGCTFNAPEGDYALWDYSTKTMTFDGCEFNISGKGVNVYVEAGNAGSEARKVEAKDCTINSTKANKAFLNIKNKTQAYEVTLSGDNKVNGLDANSTTGSSLYQVETTEVTETSGKTVKVQEKATDGTLTTVYEVKAASTAVAMVGGVEYASLAEAIAAATMNSTVKLLADTRENVTIDKQLTLDLNGHTLNGGTVKAKPALTITARTVTIKDSSEAQTGTIMREDTAENSGVSSHYVIDIQGNAWVMFESGIVKNNSGTAAGKGASLVRVGNDSVEKYPGLNIKGGSFTQDNFIVIKVDRGDLFLNGGTLNSTDSYAVENWFRATIKGGTVNGAVSSWTYSSGSNSTLTISGGTINGDVESVSYDGSAGKKASVSITGGTVNGTLIAGIYNSMTEPTKEMATIEVTGGTFSSDPTKYLVAGSTVTPNSDGTFGVAKAYLAQVGENKYYTMDEAFKAQTASGEPIVLLRDYTTGSTFNSGSINRTVDLNKHTWTYTGTDVNDAAFEINHSDVTLTVKNGTVVSSTMVGLIPSAMGGTIKYDNSGLVLDGVTATANGHSGIETNGNNTNDRVTLKNSTLNVPNGFGIYFPSSGELIIENSKITAKTMGVQVCSGALSISGANTAITVTGDAVPKAENDGAIQDGAAISIVNRTGYKGLGTVTVSGGKFTAKEGNSAIKAYNWASNTESAFTASDKVAVSGGTFSSEVSEDLCAEGFIPTKNADGTYGVKTGMYVAQIGSTKYETLEEAVAAVKDGEVIVVSAGEYKLPSSQQGLYTGKAFTIKAADGAKVSFDMSNAVTLGGAKVTFERVTFDYKTNGNYIGLQHADTLVYNNCTINGMVFLYATNETFNDCIFNQTSADAYNVWTYGAKNVKFNGCVFNCVGRCVLVYNEGAVSKTELEVVDTDFIASEPASGKAAIEIDTRFMADGATITVDGKTKADGFATGSNSGNSLWNDKKQTAAENKNTTVIVNGETVFEPAIIDLDTFIKKLIASGYNFDGTLKNVGKLTVKWSPVSGCYDTRAEHTCTVNGVTATGNTPKRVNNSLTQFQLFEGSDVAVIIKNVKFVYEPADFTVCENSGWAGSYTAAQAPAGQLYFMTTGDVTVDSCDFDKVVFTTFNTTGTTTVKDCTFKDVYNNYAIKDIRGEKVSVTGTTIEKCGGGIMVSSTGTVSNVTITGNTFKDVDVAGTAPADKVGTRAILQIASSGKYENKAFDFSGNTAKNCGPVIRQLNKSVAPVGSSLKYLTESPNSASGLYTSDSEVSGYIKDENGNVTISTAEGLFWFAKQVNSGNNFAGKTVKLANDIDLNNELWTPIGIYNDSETHFKGTFDGQNHTVSGLNVVEYSKNGVGFFGKTFTGTIKNLTVEGNITANGCNYVGGIVGHGYATITNCVFKGDITNNSGYQIGGIAGSGGFTITNCSVYGNIHGESWVGGIAGNVQDGGAYINCYVEGVISANSSYGGASAAGIAAIPLYKSQKINGCYSNTIVKCGDEEINAPIIGCYNGDNNITADTELFIHDNSWNKQKNPNDSYEVKESNTVIEGKTVSRDNNLIMLEDDLKYVEGDLSAVRIMAGSAVTQEQVDALAMAQIGDRKYTSLDAAIAAADAGETVKLLADVTADVVINKNITLDLGGKTLTNTNSGKATITIAAGTTATVKNGNVVGGTSYYNIAVGTSVNSTANLTLEDVTATAGNTDSSMIDNWGTLTITSGTYSGGLNVVKSEEGSTLTINGGKFELNYAVSNKYNGVILSAGTTMITGGEFIQNATTPRWGHPQVVLAMQVDGYISKIEITGGTFTNNKSGESIFHGSGKANSSNFEVSGGTFNKSVSQSYFAKGYECVKKADGTYGVQEAMKGSKNYPYTLAELSVMTRDEYIAAQEALGGTMYVEIGDYSYDKNGVLGNGKRDDTLHQTEDRSVLNGYNSNGYLGEKNDGANGKNIIFVGGSITSGVTGYKDIDNIGTSLLLAVPAYTNVTFEGVTFKNVISFDYQLYTGPWSQLGKLKFDNCKFNGLIVGAIASQTLTFNKCTFTNYINTISANNSNPTWIRPAYGNWSKGDNEGQGSDFKSLTTINFTNNTVTSTRPVKFERIAQWEMDTKVSVKNNKVTISAQEGDTSTKSVGFYFGANAKFDLTLDGNKKLGDTSALYTAVYSAPNEKSYAGLPAGSTVKDAAGNDVEVAGVIWKTTDALTLKTTTEAVEVAGVKFATLEEAYAAAANGDTITLLEDCKSDRINLEDKSVTVVLNGKTLTSTAAYGVMFCAKNGNKITIDGNVEGSKLVGTLMITAETDGHIEVNGGTYENSQYCPIYVNGAVNSENSTVTVKNAIINATNSNSNQDMGCAVYLAGYSTSVFENCTITAPVTGIEIRAGKLTLNNCDVTGGNREVTAEANGNGTTVTNAALAISQHTTKKPIEVIINGGTFNGTAAVYQTDVQGTGSADVKIAVKNGTFNGTISGETDGAIVISGGKFKVKVDDKYFDGDHACSTDKTGDYYTVTGHPITGIGISIGESLTLRITVDKSYKNGKLKYTYIGAKDGKVHSGIVYRAEKDKKGNWVFRISDINAQRADVIYTVQYVDESEKEVGSAKEVSILKYCEGLVEQYKNADEAVKNSVNTLVCKLLNYSAAAMDYRQETDGGDRYNNMTWGERATALRKRAVELCGTVTDYAFEVSHEIRDYGYDDNAVGANGEKKVGIEFSDKIRLFFNINYNENYTYTYNGLKCIPEEVSSASTTHRIYVTVAPFAYDSEHCIEISDADGFVYEIAYSLDNVLEIISEKNSGTAISNLAKATYEYCRALADFAKYFK